MLQTANFLFVFIVIEIKLTFDDLAAMKKKKKSKTIPKSRASKEEEGYHFGSFPNQSKTLDVEVVEESRLKVPNVSPPVAEIVISMNATLRPSSKVDYVGKYLKVNHLDHCAHSVLYI